MITIETNVYTFDELSDKAQEKARDWYRESSINDVWWEFVYEDANNVGLRIEGFDLGRGKMIDISFSEPDTEVLKRIKYTHGEECDTYKVAMKFLAVLTGIRMRGEDESEWTDDREGAHKAFHESLKQSYLKMLEDELEFQNSDAAVDDAIKMNEYTFTENGERFG